MSVELPERVYVKSWLIDPRFTEEWLNKFWEDNVLLTGTREAALRFQQELSGVRTRLAPEHHDFRGLTAAITWLGGLTTGMYDLRKRYDKRWDQVESEMLDVIGALCEERETMRKLYQPLIEQAHESQERAEYYRSLLDDNHIEY